LENIPDSPVYDSSTEELSRPPYLRLLLPQFRSSSSLLKKRSLKYRQEDYQWSILRTGKSWESRLKLAASKTPIDDRYLWLNHLKPSFSYPHLNKTSSPSKREKKVIEETK